MKEIFFAIIVAICFLSFVMADTDEKIPPVIKMELQRLEEVWNILDQCAHDIWPGWTGYADIPFLFDYENNVRMLVGHPEPPEGFIVVSGIEVRGKKVYLDRRKEIPVSLTWPTRGGGGPIPFGTYRDKQVQTVWIQFTPHSYSPGESQNSMVTEDQILIYIHELFHIFQKSFHLRHENLRYNPDTNYAVYSEIEGEALRRAFLEKDDSKALECLKDFIIARKLKHASMTQTEQIEEVGEDFMEGTATYSEYAALRQIAKGYQTQLTKEDACFSGFKNLDYYFEEKLKNLEKFKGDTFESRSKCYSYGCFQAILLDRFVPGWQRDIPRKYSSLHSILIAVLNLNEAEENAVKARIKANYSYDALFARHNVLMETRDKLFREYYAQQGKVYIVNFKSTREYLDIKTEPDARIFKLGLRNLYPQGIKQILVKDVQWEGKGKTVVQDQLYHIRYVDTQNQGYTINSSKKEGDIYYDAVVSTNGFTLKAPKIRVKEREGRVKFIILSKVKEK